MEPIDLLVIALIAMAEEAAAGEEKEEVT